MYPKRIAELMKKLEMGTLSPDEKNEINDVLNKAIKEWPERERKIQNFIDSLPNAYGNQIQKTPLQESIQKDEHYKKLLRHREGRRICCGV